MSDIRPIETIYANPLAQASDIADWIMEGQGLTSFPRGKLRMESARPMEDGQFANIVFWCPASLPDHVRISWDFHALHEPGLAILFFSAIGRHGGSIFDPTCAKRSGPYDQYHHGDINTLHISYFRRKNPGEIQFHTCNLRKSFGSHMVAQGADPLPDAAHFHAPHRITVIKSGPHVAFCINDLTLLRWTDPGSPDTGPVLGPGHIGFRQMCPLIAEYTNLQVERIEPLT